MLFNMEHFSDQGFALQWPETGISNISDSNGTFEIPPTTNMEQLSSKPPSLSSNNIGFPNTVYYQHVNSSIKNDMSYINDMSRPLQHLQEEFGFKNEASTSTSITSVATHTDSNQPFMLKEHHKISQTSTGFSVTINPSMSTHVLPSFHSTVAGDFVNYHQSSTTLQPSTTWGDQSYMNSQPHGDSSKTSDRSGRISQVEFNGIASPNNKQFSGSLTGGQLGSSQVMQMVNPQSYQQVQTSQGLVSSTLPVNQPQAGIPATVSAAAKPRVRARRGQATDPHSIAERLRRERIAERMKALQELVPNANKTDKASMLDEIIDYVKFLQLQVKVLSMSRLGGASAVAPLIADLSTEGSANLLSSLSSTKSVQDGLAMAESQVAKLMEDDMGSAMQFLQAKGLCLMPVSLASIISTNKSRPSSGNMEPQTIPTLSQPWISSASSTTTFASAASTACRDGDSNLGKGM